MPLTDRMKHYSKLWARVSRAQKRKCEDVESHNPEKSVREISSGTHVITEVNQTPEPNTIFYEDTQEMVSETEMDANEDVVGPTQRKELSEWASTFGV